ncbi:MULTISPECIES: NAD(P)H-dependent glycerol-3-phosphate dehydrogenase [Thiorhodovibrio]|uniref:NAD(P)H-dependent glycerol-3-phosphate dehydrogenase n=1 Tax=Thiorhodovibrio TaxID=61593 RepID=UPI001912A14C|nr:MULTISPECIES: NAD(P)H-dependent glycerol-3-phosphate dehydrogenase [Thiorhodovibrio]MBK5971062.1 glycerol-3-phosphate dehydrogenase [Thiorhodovibrio winogradskyi]WPL10571.1 Glycerol-3-phosphate dehydrogenase [NAD(P)+] [Thiorhodovibrio litoralis]
MATVAMIGAGSWGTALALQLCRNGHQVRLWGHEPALMERMAEARENRDFLPGFALPPALEPVSDLATAGADADAVVIVVPSQFFASVVAQLLPLLPADMGIGWATKGFDPEGGRLLHEVIREQSPQRELGVLSGPSFAGEVAKGLPTAVTVAASSEGYARSLAALFHGQRFRTYHHDDLIGVQVGGAAKNVLAIATGIADGLGFGANTRSALITRGLTELIRLGCALGARRETFMGLAGLGDLVLTCTDNQSRNRRLGLALAAGTPLKQAQSDIGQEVEGVITATAVHKLATSHQVDMPICEQVHAVLYQGRTPQEATTRLLERAGKPELD